MSSVAYRRDLEICTLPELGDLVLVRHRPTGWVYRFVIRSRAAADALLARWTEHSGSLTYQFVPGGPGEVELNGEYLQLVSSS